MEVRLICIGKLKEDYWKKAVAEYSARMTPLCRFSVIELPEHRLSDDPSPAEIRGGIEREGGYIMDKLGDRRDTLVIAMCVEGDLWSSEQLASAVMDAGVSGKSRVDVVIGGSYGLSDEVKRRADKRVSVGRMTFPHQLCRVMLCEQLYRAFMINAGRKYHK